MNEELRYKKIWRLCDHENNNSTIFSHFSPEVISVFISHLKNDIELEFKDNPELWQKIWHMIDNRYYSQKYR